MSVYAVDTNVVVRLLTLDDQTQAAQAQRIFTEATMIHIPVTVLLETEWVLRYSYGFEAATIAGALSKVLALSNVQTAVPEALRIALQGLAQGLDFADALHLALSPAETTLLTFDRSFVRKAVQLGYTQIKNL